MKIDEASINHNALRLIQDEASWVMNVDNIETENAMSAIVTLAKIDGICSLSEELKKTLRE